MYLNDYDYYGYISRMFYRCSQSRLTRAERCKEADWLSSRILYSGISPTAAMYVEPTVLILSMARKRSSPSSWSNKHTFVQTYLSGDHTFYFYKIEGTVGEMTLFTCRGRRAEIAIATDKTTKLDAIAI